MREIWYFSWIFFVTGPFRGYQKCLRLWPWLWRLNYFDKNFNLVNKFSTMCARALIFCTSIFDKAFPFVPTFVLPLMLEFDLFSEKINLASYFWTVSARVLTFHMSIPCDKIFPCITNILPCDVDPGIWPTFLKTLTLLITFQQWVSFFSYFTWKRSFCLY